MSKIFQKYFKKFPKFPKISKKNQKNSSKKCKKNISKMRRRRFWTTKIILMAKSQFFRFFWGTRYKIQKIFRTKTILLQIY